jgi:hypothetical protein
MWVNSRTINLSSVFYQVLFDSVTSIFILLMALLKLKCQTYSLESVQWSGKVWWSKSVIPLFGRWRQEDTKASPGKVSETLSQKQNTNKSAGV